MKNKTLWWVIGIIALLGILYYAWRRGVFGLSTLGRKPGGECDGDATQRIIEGCSRPIYNTGGAKETCLTIGEGKLAGFESCHTGGQVGTKAFRDLATGREWFFNYQSGKKCCYVSSPKYSPLLPIGTPIDWIE